MTEDRGQMAEDREYGIRKSECGMGKYSISDFGMDKQMAKRIRHRSQLWEIAMDNFKLGASP
jgi:hypothetical protein